jgi:uncharacterized membrane-anchored protein
MSWTRRLLILGGLLLVLGAANAIILQKERVRQSARLVLLELRPVDPRSLMQGDYMDLAFADAVVRPPEGTELPSRGAAVMSLDAGGIAVFARVDDGSPLGPNEMRLRYLGRAPDGELDFGGNAFFFQEGDAELYAQARYGMFRVDEDGNSVLVGLADENRQEILKLPE